MDIVIVTLFTYVYVGCYRPQAAGLRFRCRLPGMVELWLYRNSSFSNCRPTYLRNNSLVSYVHAFSNYSYQCHNYIIYVFVKELLNKFTTSMTHFHQTNLHFLIGFKCLHSSYSVGCKLFYVTGFSNTLTTCSNLKIESGGRLSKIGVRL